MSRVALWEDPHSSSELYYSLSEHCDLFTFLVTCHYTCFSEPKRSITTIRFKNPAKILRFVYSTHSPFNACADKCPLCSLGANTELYYISGDCALIPRQSTNCNQKHGGFWPNLRHFDVTVSLFSCSTPLTRYLSGKNLSMSRGQWMAP